MTDFATQCRNLSQREALIQLVKLLLAYDRLQKKKAVAPRTMRGSPCFAVIDGGKKEGR